MLLRVRDNVKPQRMQESHPSRGAIFTQSQPARRVSEGALNEALNQAGFVRLSCWLANPNK